MAKWIEHEGELINLDNFRFIRRAEKPFYYGGDKYIIQLLKEELDKTPYEMTFYFIEGREEEYRKIRKMLLGR